MSNLDLILKPMSLDHFNRKLNCLMIDYEANIYDFEIAIKAGLFVLDLPILPFEQLEPWYFWPGEELLSLLDIYLEKPMTEKQFQLMQLLTNRQLNWSLYPSEINIDSFQVYHPN